MSKEYVIPDSPCEAEGHVRHLCKLTEDFFHLRNAEEYREIVKSAEFKCQFCGRTAKSEENLCYPIEL
jgi:hypothetical protein